MFLLYLSDKLLFSLRLWLEDSLDLNDLLLERASLFNTVKCHTSTINVFMKPYFFCLQIHLFLFCFCNHQEYFVIFLKQFFSFCLSSFPVSSVPYFSFVLSPILLFYIANYSPFLAPYLRSEP